MLDDYGDDRRAQTGWSFKLNLLKLPTFWHDLRERKKKRESELDAENERLRASDAAWEALFAKPSGDEKDG